MSHKRVASRVKVAMLVTIGISMVMFRPQFACAVNIYKTGFDVTEGYNTNLDLIGQKGWLGDGTGGNGIVSGWLPGIGQQAYIGFGPPAGTEASLFVYYPVNQNASQVQFSVTFSILDSSLPNTNRDDFYWSVFNQQSNQLFTVDFDNEELRVYYYLDDEKGRTWAGLNFTNDTAYQLAISMNFASNRWSATLNSAPVASNQPITTINAPLNLGDVDAAWAIWDAKAPGDNFMVFDNYSISATVPPPQLKILGRTNNVPTLRISGQPGNRFAVEASTNLTSWLPLTTNITTGGSFTYADNSATGLLRRFYRARWVP